MTENTTTEKIVPDREVVVYPKSFDKKGKQLESTDQMMVRALKEAQKKGHDKISVQTEDEKQWSVLFYS